MRVNPNPMPDLMAALNQTELEEQQAELQISTGKSVNEPSDNPTAAALLVENNDQATFNTGYLQSISAVQGQLSTASSTLSSVTTALQQALSLGVEAGGGTLSASDQAAIANQLQGIQSQLVSLANTTYEGNYIFAGTATNAPPYVVDAAAPPVLTIKATPMSMRYRSAMDTSSPSTCLDRSCFPLPAMTFFLPSTTSSRPCKPIVALAPPSTQ